MFKLLPKTKNLSIGLRGEKAAVTYLKSLNYAILETNFCNNKGRRIGEVDIIAKDGEEIVFIEVKTKENNNINASLPEENITRSKLYKLNKIASFYISSKKLYSSPYRFDAISIVSDSQANTAKLRHLKNIFI
ncbi:MAG: YraN family protein [Candidatus Moranbacteria bacterium]|nr:YraN family protein [Candidatus Moranbacteria bacterium]